MRFNVPKNSAVINHDAGFTSKTNSYVDGSHLQSLKKNNLTLNEKFINLLMKNGNKLKASRIFYDSLKILYSKSLKSILKNKTFTSQHLLNKQFNYSGISDYKPVASNLLFNSSCCVLPLEKNSGEMHNTLVLLNANKLFIKAVNNVKPSVETRNVKVSGRTYPVPAVIGKHRQQILGIRWLIECATKNKKNTCASFSECLASELYEASCLSGKAKQKRDVLHKHAESNRAYIRFKWW